MGNVLNFSVTREIVALTDVKFEVQCYAPEFMCSILENWNIINISCLWIEVLRFGSCESVTADTVMFMSYRELLRGKEETLLRIIHPNVLLLALLTEQDLLDECSEQAIAAERTNFDRNRRLLEWLKQSPREAFDGFLRALRTNGQGHVANYIDGTPGNELGEIDTFFYRATYGQA